MEANKRLIDNCIRALNERNLAELNGLLAPEGLPARKPVELTDRQRIREWFAELDARASEGHAAATVDWDGVAEGWAAGNVKKWSGAPESGLMLIRFAGGRVVEGWLVDEKNSVLQSPQGSPVSLRMAQVGE